MIDLRKEQDKFILVGVDTGELDFPIDESMKELSNLVDTTGEAVVGEIVQKLNYPDPRYYIGSGKVKELQDLISLNNATGIVCNDELRPVQIRNLTDKLDVKVLDRTLVILDIFASRASTAEGKVQVELAQQRYRLTHLVGMGKVLSRLGGGIGTRGPGEKQLETDRRHIRNKIIELERELKKIKTHREILRERREDNSEIVVSLVGYTNAGKSTLLNSLTDSDVFVYDKLFATLDTTSRELELGGSQKVILTDTVGFINKLPHNLIQAFRSTLEELQYSDIILHVVDASDNARENHMEVVYKTLKELEVVDTPIITVYNKIDLDVDYPLPNDRFAEKEVKASAITGEGLETLKDEIEIELQNIRRRVILKIPFEEGSLMNQIREKSEIQVEIYTEDGVYLEAYVNDEIYNRTKIYQREKMIIEDPQKKTP